MCDTKRKTVQNIVVSSILSHPVFVPADLFLFGGIVNDFPPREAIRSMKIDSDATGLFLFRSDDQNRRPDEWKNEDIECWEVRVFSSPI